MKIYIVFYCGSVYDGDKYKAAFTTREKAQEYIKWIAPDPHEAQWYDIAEDVVQ